MIESIWTNLSSADPSTEIFIADTGPPVSMGTLAGEIESLRVLLAGGEGPVFLYCESLFCFVAGLWAGLLTSRGVVLPGHLSPEYLIEIGAKDGTIVTDLDARLENRIVVPTATGPGMPHRLPHPESDARVTFFTSGSTSVPKPCPKTLSQLEAEVIALERLWGATGGRVVSTVSHQHIYGLLFGALWPMAVGRQMYVNRAATWDVVVRRFREGDIFVSGPAHLSRLPPNLNLKGRPSRIFSSGGPLKLADAQETSRMFGVWPIEVLGSTETGGVAWREQRFAGERWQPLPGVQVTADANDALYVSSPYTGGTTPVELGDRGMIDETGRIDRFGRADRVAKIEGKRVSLTRVETALSDLSSVADCVVLELKEPRHAIGAVVVLEEGGLERKAEVGRFRYSRELRQMLAPRLASFERPRYWRFVSEIPEDAQGKRPAGLLRALFEQKPDEMPIVRQQDINGDLASFELEFGDDLRWFDGHFPDQPIVPGVAQVHIASVLAKRLWGVMCSGRRMSRVKFRKVMTSGDVALLTLTRKHSTRIDFEYRVDGAVTASGSLDAGAE